MGRAPPHFLPSPPVLFRVVINTGQFHLLDEYLQRKQVRQGLLSAGPSFVW